jgi:hypothetical protein
MDVRSRQVSRRTALRIGAVAGLSAPSWARAQAVADARVALVIGNSAYANAPLRNPANDARAMSLLLERMGFDVVTQSDATRVQIQHAITRARGRLRGRNCVGLFYFAGHALQLDWRNYILPVDASPGSAVEVPQQAVDVQTILDSFRGAGSRTNIVVLDACRDNPFGASATGRGLAPVDAPAGTFLAYATAPGNVADDGGATDGNGLYTRFLLQEIQRADAKIEDVFKRVRLQVRQASRGRQVPWESTSLEDDFVFSTGQTAQRETELQRSASFDAEKSDWDRIKDSAIAADFFNFLLKHPTGMLAEPAQFRLDQIVAPAIQPAAPSNGVTALRSGLARFKLGDFFQWNALDHLTSKSWRFRWAVTAASDRRVEINDGTIVLDQMGGLVLDRFGTKDPALVQAPAELALGKRWRSGYRNHLPARRGTEWCYAESRVVATEVVEVPAGRFDTCRVEQQGESIGHNWRTLWSGTIWIDPSTMFIVRQEFRHRNARYPQLTVHQTNDLVRMTLTPRA